MPSSKAAKKKQRLKKAAAERNAGLSQDITPLVSGLEPKSYEQVIVNAARKFDDVANMVVEQHQSLVKIRAHEQTLVADFARMTKTIERSLGAKYHQLLAPTTAEDRPTRVRKYAKKLANDIDAALNYMTAEITPDSLYATKFAALDDMRAVLESILRCPKPLLSALSRQPSFKSWDIKLMVVLKHLNCDVMGKLKCGKFRCGEQETPTQWMKDMKRLHWIDHAFQFKYERVQATTIPQAVKHEVTIRQKSLNPSLEPDLAGPSESASSSEPVKTEPPKAKLTKGELKNMVSPLFPSILEQIMTSTALAHASAIPALRAVRKIKAAAESSMAQDWARVAGVVHSGLNDRYCIRKTYRHGFSVHAYANESAEVTDEALTKFYMELKNLYKPLLATKIAALESCRKVLEDLLCCPDELRDAICFHVGSDQTNTWAFNMVKILDCFEDGEIYKLVKGETDEPNEFWTKRSVPALMELVKDKAPVGHPDRREFFRGGLREVWLRVYAAVIKYGPPPKTLMFERLCVCCYCDDLDEEDYCSCGNGEGFDDEEDESFHEAMLALLSPNPFLL
ncbi:hypothetical protein QC761_203335 [Podospora bellae-mahoneyi]|uniref:Uncharacterized protein n=1 Tax=Podospora bellae-mahoneyi TaxID=2093777 RepID=A0ABR0FR92_9PEZI|nr:hypothetical protein QC761_203335 [Podospora bellae-mahoneyi]